MADTKTRRNSIEVAVDDFESAFSRFTAEYQTVYRFLEKASKVASGDQKDQLQKVCTILKPIVDSYASQ